MIILPIWLVPFGQSHVLKWISFESEVYLVFNTLVKQLKDCNKENKQKKMVNVQAGFSLKACFQSQFPRGQYLIRCQAKFGGLSVWVILALAFWHFHRTDCGEEIWSTWKAVNQALKECSDVLQKYWALMSVLLPSIENKNWMSTFARVGGEAWSQVTSNLSYK